MARPESRDDVAHRSVPLWSLSNDDDAEETEEPIPIAVLTRPGAREASNQSACILVMTSHAAALDQVVQARPSEGLSAWRSLSRRRFEPHFRTHFGGVTFAAAIATLTAVHLVLHGFSRGLLARVEAFTRELTQYEQAP